MKVMSYGVAPARIHQEPQGRNPEQVDLTVCTRCGSGWGFEIVEQVEIWSCTHCGYEARERSVDHSAMQDASHESMIS